MRAAILLAGGLSRRFGRRNKLLEQVRGRPLLIHTLTMVRGIIDGRIVVATGADHARVEKAVRQAALPGVTIVRARDYREGIGATLRAGIAALRPIERELLVFLGDMPAVPPAIVRRLRLVPGRDLVRPALGGKPGHPVLVRTTAARDAAPAGDVGLRMAQGRAGVVATEARGALFDIDSRRAFARFRRTGRV